MSNGYTSLFTGATLTNNNTGAIAENANLDIFSHNDDTFFYLGFTLLEDTLHHYCTITPTDDAKKWECSGPIFDYAKIYWDGDTPTKIIFVTPDGEAYVVDLT